MQLLRHQRERVGRQIRRARLDCGMSHDKLAAKVGTSRQHLIKLEKGMHLPRPEMLEAIARETGKSESFFDAEDDEESDPMVEITRALNRMVENAVIAQMNAEGGDRWQNVLEDVNA